MLVKGATGDNCALCNLLSVDGYVSSSMIIHNRETKNENENSSNLLRDNSSQYGTSLNEMWVILPRWFGLEHNKVF